MIVEQLGKQSASPARVADRGPVVQFEDELNLTQVRRNFKHNSFI